MKRKAPLTPSTSELHEMYPISVVSEVVAESRQVFADRLRNPDAAIIINGPCGITEHDSAADLRLEAKNLSRTISQTGAMTVYRANMFKPRTDPEAWHGIETTDPVKAFSVAYGLAACGIRLSQELAHPDYHVQRYAPLMTMGWTGSRTLDVPDGDKIITNLCMQDIGLPMGIKTGLTGKIDRALELIENVNRRREEMAQRVGNVAVAPAFLIFRGGSEIMSSGLWEEEYLRALEATDGMMIVDTAHGSSMAHDENHQKSNSGQVSAYRHVIDLVSEGQVPAGVMTEASSRPSATDPVMAVSDTIQLARELRDVRSSQLNVSDNAILC